MAFIPPTCKVELGDYMSNVIEIKAISFAYPQTNKIILDKCTLNIAPGELVSILGPNGAGKSTLLNCACNLLSPQSGEVIIGGKNICNLEQKDIAKTIGYVQQYQQSAFAHSVFDYVLMGRANNIGLFQKPTKNDKEKVEEVLCRMGISYLSNAAITEISGGERQQAAIARAIAQDPKVIFFDEPTAHLDYGNQINTLRLIGSLQKQGYAVVMTTHNPDHCMMLGGKVAVLSKEGRLEVGDSAEILTEERLKRIYNTELCLTYVQPVDRIACIPRGI